MNSRLQGQGSSREEDGEGGTATDFTLHFNAAAVGLYQVLGDGESEACAAHLARASWINPIEALENSRLLIARYANARVHHADHYFTISCGGMHSDAPPGWRVLHGVVEQVLQLSLPKTAFADQSPAVTKPNTPNPLLNCCQLRP